MERGPGEDQSASDLHKNKIRRHFSLTEKYEIKPEKGKTVIGFFANVNFFHTMSLWVPCRRTGNRLLQVYPSIH